MPMSLKVMLKKVAHKGQITQEEYDALVKKLDGHDKEIRNKAIDEFAEKFVFQAVCQGCSGCCNCYELGRQMQCGEYQRYMEIAEQLKEE